MSPGGGPHDEPEDGQRRAGSGSPGLSTSSLRLEWFIRSRAIASSSDSDRAFVSGTVLALEAGVERLHLGGVLRAAQSVGDPSPVAQQELPRPFVAREYRVLVVMDDDPGRGDPQAVKTRRGTLPGPESQAAIGARPRRPAEHQLRDVVDDQDRAERERLGTQLAAGIGRQAPGLQALGHGYPEIGRGAACAADSSCPAIRVAGRRPSTAGEGNGSRTS